MKIETDEVNKTKALLEKNQDDAKTIIQASRMLVCERVGVKLKQQKQKEYFWKKRKEKDIENEKKLTQLHALFKGKWKDKKIRGKKS